MANLAISSGGWEGNKHSTVRVDRRRPFEGRGLAILRAGEPGTLRLTASADGLRAASISIPVTRGRPAPVIPAVGDGEEEPS